MSKFRNFNYNYTIFTENTETFLQGLITTYHVYSLETCPTTGRPHIQGFIVFPNPRHLSALRNQFFEPKNGSGYLDNCKGNSISNLDYSTKEGSYYESGNRPLTPEEKGIKEQHRWEQYKQLNRAGQADLIPFDVYIRYKRSFNEDAAEHIPIEKLSRLDTTNLYEWQKVVIDKLLNVTDDRKILWIYDPEGGKGKSELYSYLVEQGAFPMAMGKYADMAYTVPQKGCNIFMFNLARQQEVYVQYNFLEDLKDGSIHSTKYVPVYKRFKRPHVVVFANCLPDEQKMSKDRFEILYI